MQFSTLAIAAAVLGFTSAAPTKSVRRGYWNISPTDLFEFDNVNGKVLQTQGEVYRAQGADISTLVNFPVDLGDSAANYACQIMFTTTKGASPAGSAKYQLFISLQPHAATDTSNFRNQYIATYAWNADDSTFYAEDGDGIFACPAGNSNGFEFVASGDNDSIEVNAEELTLHVIFPDQEWNGGAAN